MGERSVAPAQDAASRAEVPPARPAFDVIVLSVLASTQRDVLHTRRTIQQAHTHARHQGELKSKAHHLYKRTESVCQITSGWCTAIVTRRKRHSRKHNPIQKGA